MRYYLTTFDPINNKWHVVDMFTHGPLTISRKKVYPLMVATMAQSEMDDHKLYGNVIMDKDKL